MYIFQKRHGNGVFETMDGAVINTVWECDMKTGPGQVMCANGTIIAAESLFRNDKQASFNLEDDSTGLLLRQQNRPSRDKYEVINRNLNGIFYVFNFVKSKCMIHFRNTRRRTWQIWLKPNQYPYQFIRPSVPSTSPDTFKNLTKYKRYIGKRISNLTPNFL